MLQVSVYTTLHTPTEQTEGLFLSPTHPRMFTRSWDTGIQGSESSFPREDLDSCQGNATPCLHCSIPRELYPNAVNINNVVVLLTLAVNNPR